MSEPDEDWFDPDIASMDLGYGEKAGLQIYRNYTRSFETHAIKQFVEALDRETLDLGDYRRLVALISSEEPRFLPVIVCAFADDLLKEVFKGALPDKVPGGKAKLLSGYGPLSDFSKRIQMAYAFDVLSRDLMEELDRLRSVRNKISHSWDAGSLGEFFSEGRLTEMVRIEEMLPEREDLAAEFSGGFTPLVAFRVRLFWIVGRLVYEAAGYTRAKRANLRPTHALYNEPRPKWLGQIAKIALEASREVAGSTSAP